MGQQVLGFATWPGRNRRIFRAPYEFVGQHIGPTMLRMAGRACTHVEILNHVLSDGAKFLRETGGNRGIFDAMGCLC
jgi:hypothetical protein